MNGIEMDTQVSTLLWSHILNATNFSSYNYDTPNLSTYNFSSPYFSPYSYFSTNVSTYNYSSTFFSGYNYPGTNVSTYNYPILNLSAYNYPNMFDLSALDRNTSNPFGPGRPPVLTDSSLVQYRLNHQALFLLPAYGLILLLSVGGNLLVLATLLQHRAMRTPTNILLLNLSISDLLLAVVCVPFTLTGSLLRDFIFGKFACRVIPYLQAVSVSVSAWTLVTISWERYSGICEPLRSRGWRSKGSAKKMTATVWGGSLILMAPIALTSHLQPIGNSGRHKCREVWPSPVLEQLYSIGLMFFLLLLPLVLMMVAYTAITKVLRKSIINDRRNSRKYPSSRIVQTVACTRNKFTGLHIFNTSTFESRSEGRTIEGNKRTDAMSNNIDWRTNERPNQDNDGLTSVYGSRIFTLDESSKEVGRNALKSTEETSFRRRDTESTPQHRIGCQSTKVCHNVSTSSELHGDSCKQSLQTCDGDGINHRLTGKGKDLNGARGRCVPNKPRSCQLSSRRYPFLFLRRNGPYKKPHKYNSQSEQSTCDGSHDVMAESVFTISNTVTSPDCSNSSQKTLSPSRKRASFGKTRSLQKLDSVNFRSNNGLVRQPVSITDLSTVDESKLPQSSRTRRAFTSWGKSGRTLASNCSPRDRRSSIPALNCTSPLAPASLRSTSSMKSLKNKKRIIKMIGVVVLEFFICWTPLYVLNAVALFNPHMVYSFLGMNGVAGVQLLAYCSACCNPITYSFMSKSFRGAFFNVIRCRNSFPGRYSENVG